MTRFANSTAVRRTQRVPNTVNREGAPAFEQSDKVKLASILLTSFVQDQFYRSTGQTLGELKGLMDKVDPLFAAKAAVFARNEFNMRSISHVVGGEIPARVKGEKWTKNFIESVVIRPDDATEILAYYLANYGKPIPNSLKKGLALGLGKFDEYQLAKYRGDKNAVSLVDVVNLVRVKPNERNRVALQKLIDGELRSSETWEAKISQAGKAEDKEAAKAEAWTDLINSRRIGYFALLRNLRNIYNSVDTATMDRALALLVDEKLIKNSRVLPFRFATALNECGITDRRVVRALNQALDIAVANVPELPGKTLVAVDHSGSMGSHQDPKSPKGIADLFAAIIFKANDGDVVVFGNDAAYVSGLNPDDSTLTIKDQISRVSRGYATNFPAVFQVANKKYDRIITLSDMQSYMRNGYGHGPQQALANYERKRGHIHYYNFDLRGYGTTLFPTERVYELSGFSEKVFDIMAILEQDKNALVNKIEAVQF